MPNSRAVRGWVSGWHGGRGMQGCRARCARGGVTLLVWVGAAGRQPRSPRRPPNPATCPPPLSLARAPRFPPPPSSLSHIAIPTTSNFFIQYMLAKGLFSNMLRIAFPHVGSMLSAIFRALLRLGVPRSLHSAWIGYTPPGYRLSGWYNGVLQVCPLRVRAVCVRGRAFWWP